MTIPDWLISGIFGAITGALTYRIGFRRGVAAARAGLPGVEPGWYPPTPPKSEAPTTKRERPTAGTWDEDKS